MKLPKKYVPDSLTEKEKREQIKSIKEKRDRPNQEKKTKRSSHTIAFEKKYGTTIMDDAFIEKNIISKAGKDLILKKGVGAYYNAGSRPFVSVGQWSRARLASVIMGGKAREVDRKIWEKYKK
jgi:hypothetical protein